jgi:hypothetical protein
MAGPNGSPQRHKEHKEDKKAVLKAHTGLLLEKWFVVFFVLFVSLW